jgi:hypothetical protein
MPARSASSARVLGAAAIPGCGGVAGGNGGEGASCEAVARALRILLASGEMTVECSVVGFVCTVVNQSVSQTVLEYERFSINELCNGKVKVLID